MKRHVDAEALARYRSGDLTPRRSARVGRHLADCAPCTRLGEDIAGVRALLAATPAPPMPRRLAERIDAAIVAEAVSRQASGQTARQATGDAAAPRAGGQHTRRAARPRPASGTTRPRLSWLSSPAAVRSLAAAAAVLVIVGGGYGITRLTDGTSAGSGGSAASESGAAAGPAAGTGSGGIASLGGTTGPEIHYSHSGHRADITPIATSTDFTRGNLRSEVAAALAATAAGRASAASPPLVSQKAQPGSPTSAGEHPASFGNGVLPSLQGCVSRVSAGHLVLLVDVARFQGRPATVIVTWVAQHKPPQVWVVGPGCSASASDVLSHSTLASGPR